MQDGLKTLISIIGLIGVLAAAFVIWDRYHQNPKPNIPRYEGKIEDGKRSAQEIVTLDKSSEDFYRFLKRNQGKRIYINISFQVGDGLDGIDIKPLGVPSSNQPFEFTFIGDCTKHPISRRNLVDGTCNNIRVHIDPAKDVERQVNNIYGGTFQVTGYFFDGVSESYMSGQTLNLKPISADKVLS